VPQLTIVIPFHDTSNRLFLEETLVSLLENRPFDSEILVVCGEKYDDPYHLSEEGVRFLSFPNEKSPIRQINAAMETAASPVVGLLMCGTEVCENWDRDIAQTFAQPDVAVAIPTICHKKRNLNFFSSGVAYHSSGTLRHYRIGQKITDDVCVAPSVAGAFFRTSTLKKVGGFCSRFCLQIAYIDYSLTMEHLGMQTVFLPACFVSDKQSFPVFSSSFQQTRQTEWLFQLWSHRGHWFLNTLKHFFVVSAEFWGNFPQGKAFHFLAGRISGLNHYGAHRLRKQELRRLAGEFAGEFADDTDFFPEISETSRLLESETENPITKRAA